MIILSVDLGRVRTGLAICDPEEILASPIRVVMERNQDRLLDSIANEAAARHAERLVVGLPKNMDGTEGESAQNARHFAARLSERTGLACDLQDERGTTLTAHGYLNEMNVRGKKRKAVVDAAAAVIILQDYLEGRRSQREKESSV